MNLKKLTRIILLVAVLLVLSIVPVNAVVFNAAFDSDFYVNCYPDLKAAFGNDANAAYNHYLTYGIKEGRIASPVFDVKTYIRNYPDLQAAFGDNYEAAYNHFLTNGMNEGRLASDSFNVQVYIANYPDLQAAFGNDVAGAYNHYLNYGMAEGRVCGSLEAGAEAPEDHVHDFKLTKVISAATCQQDGEGIFTCECGKAEERRVIPASADYHDYQVIDTIEGIKVSKCSICGDVKTEVPEDVVHTHEYVKVENNGTIEASCTKEGKIFKQCVCGDMIEETVPMIDHVSSTPVGEGKITEGVVNCVKDGAEEVTCNECKQKFIRPISAHKFEKVSDVAATCTAEGVVTYKCKVCGETKVETTKKLDHDYRVITDASLAPTCTKSGLELKVCVACGDKLTKTVSALGHKKEGATIKRGYAVYNTKGELQPVSVDAGNVHATCTQDVAETYDCANDCRETITTIVEKRLEHRIDTTKPVKEGIIKITGKNVDGTNIYEEDANGYVVTTGNVDCTHARVKVFKCANTNCRQTVVVEITEASKHTPLAGSEKVYGATCSKDGYKTYTCTTCNQKIEEPTTEKAGHKYEYVKETCTTPATIKCSGCGKVISTTKVALDALDAYTRSAVVKLLNANNIVPATEAKPGIAIGDYVLPVALKHNFVGTPETRADGIYQYCSNCSKISDKSTWFKISGLSVKGIEKVLCKDQTCTHEFGAQIKKNMSSVNVTRNGDVITVTETGTMESYNNGHATGKWFGLILDLDINNTNLTTTGGYGIEDCDKSDVPDWTTNASNSKVIIWLTDADCGENGITITFKDTATGLTRPVTVKFVAK